MKAKAEVDDPDTAESGETYDQEIEANRVLQSLPFAFRRLRLASGQ